MTDTTTDQNTTEAQTTTETIDAHPLRDLTGFQRDLLYTVFDGSGEQNSGLGIRNRLEADYGWDGEETEREIHTSRLYGNLDRLADKGFIEKEAVDRRTNAYALTEAGRACVETHCDWIAKKVRGGED